MSNNNFLVFSDLHLNNWRYGATIKDGMNSRLLEQKKVLDRITAYSKKKKIKRLMFCGDMFHTHGKISADVLKVAYDWAKEISSCVDECFFLVGNHDTNRKDMSIHSLHWLESFGHVIDTPARFERNNTAFYFHPYTENKDDLKNFLKQVEDDSFVFLHQGVAGTPMGSGFVINEILTTDMLPNAQVFTGHYHKYKTPRAQLLILGSVMQHTWADEDSFNCWQYVDIFSSKYYDVTPCPSFSPRFITMDAESALSSYIPEYGNSYFKIKGVKLGNIEKIREYMLKNGAAAVEFDIEEEPSSKVYSIAAKDFQLQPLIKVFEQVRKVSPERSKVGEELRREAS